MIIDIAQQIDPETRFFYLDTDVLFDETYATRDALAERYGIEFERYVGHLARGAGARLRRRAVDAPARRLLRDPQGRADARGARRASTAGSRASAARTRETRAGAAKFGWDRRFGLWKLNPLADWTEQDVWRYINDHDVPYNPLHDEGYPSIGCTHCTRPPGAGESPRAGRWADVREDRVRAQRIAAPSGARARTAPCLTTTASLPGLREIPNGLRPTPGKLSN